MLVLEWADNKVGVFLFGVEASQVPWGLHGHIFLHPFADFIKLAGVMELNPMLLVHIAQFEAPKGAAGSHTPPGIILSLSVTLTSDAALI